MGGPEQAQPLTTRAASRRSAPRPNKTAETTRAQSLPPLITQAIYSHRPATDRTAGRPVDRVHVRWRPRRQGCLPGERRGVRLGCLFVVRLALPVDLCSDCVAAPG